MVWDTSLGRDSFVRGLSFAFSGSELVVGHVGRSKWFSCLSIQRVLGSSYLWLLCIFSGVPTRLLLLLVGTCGS